MMNETTLDQHNSGFQLKLAVNFDNLQWNMFDSKLEVNKVVTDSHV